MPAGSWEEGAGSGQVLFPKGHWQVVMTKGPGRFRSQRALGRFCLQKGSGRRLRAGSSYAALVCSAPMRGVISGEGVFRVAAGTP